MSLLMVDAMHICGLDYAEWVASRFGMFSEEYCRTFDTPIAICVASHGHTGPHDFRPDGELLLDCRGEDEERWVCRIA